MKKCPCCNSSRIIHNQNGFKCLKCGYILIKNKHLINLKKNGKLEV